MAYSRRYVDPSFLSRLQELDKTLYPLWNTDTERWEIHRNGKSVMVVQTTDGEFERLDNRIIQKLFLIDCAKYRDKFDFIRHLHLEDEALMKKKRHEQDEFIRACHRDAAPFLRGRKSVTAKVQNA